MVQIERLRWEDLSYSSNEKTEEQNGESEEVEQIQSEVAIVIRHRKWKLLALLWRRMKWSFQKHLLHW